MVASIYAFVYNSLYTVGMYTVGIGLLELYMLNSCKSAVSCRQCTRQLE